MIDGIEGKKIKIVSGIEVSPLKILVLTLLRNIGLFYEKNRVKTFRIYFFTLKGRLKVFCSQTLIFKGCCNDRIPFILGVLGPNTSLKCHYLE